MLTSEALSKESETDGLSIHLTIHQNSTELYCTIVSALLHPPRPPASSNLTPSSLPFTITLSNLKPSCLH